MSVKQVGKRDKVILFLLEIFTAENCSRAGGDLKDNNPKNMKVIFVLNEITMNSTCLCNFAVQIMYLYSFILVKNTSIEQLLVAGLEVHSVFCHQQS